MEASTRFRNKVGVWCISTFVVALLVAFVVTKIGIDYYDHFDYFSKYPQYRAHASVYHDTYEMLHHVQNENELNPFYMADDLTPQVADEAIKIWGYGPIDRPEDLFLRVLLVCGQHGREYVSSEICFNIIRMLQLYSRDPQFTNRLEALHTQKIGLWVVPVMNPWARHHVEVNLSHACQRTNANGVDLNRNFPSPVTPRARATMFDDGKTPEDDPGPNPLSEYETVAIAEYMSFVKPHVVVNVHSGAHDILLPFDYTADVIPPHYATMVSLAKSAKSVACPECGISSAAVSLYDAAGTLMDYAVLFGHVQLALTLEVYQSPTIKNDGSSVMTPEECRDFFNPTDGDELLQVNTKWIEFILTYIERVYDNVHKS